MKQTLTLTIGLPASGKTTWCKKLISTTSGTIRVNRDDIRQQLRPGYQFGDFKLEGVVTKISHSSVRSALESGYSVIVDDTNLNQQAVEAFRAIAESCNSYFKIRDFCDVPIDVCIDRDRHRGIEEGQFWVGCQVITKMALRYGILKYGKVILVDLDGTLCDITTRRKKASRNDGGINFGLFHSKQLLDTDTPRFDIINEVNKAKAEHGCRMIIVSGRSSAVENDSDKEAILQYSKNWLTRHGVKYDDVLMRQQGDYRSDVEVKREFLGLIGKQNVIRVWDDRAQVVSFWREQGLDVRVCDPDDPINGGHF